MNRSCKECGEPEHQFGCSKPPFITVEMWRSLTDAERLDAEAECKKRGYRWVDGEGWKECKGKAAARALAVLVLDLRTATWLANHDPKALDQAREALKPFGWPDRDALLANLAVRQTLMCLCGCPESDHRREHSLASEKRLHCRCGKCTEFRCALADDRKK